jgi:two-component system NtrC family sensor kinase
MAKRKNPVRTPVKRDNASTARKRTEADVETKKETSTLRRELNEALERQKAIAIENTRLLKELGQRANDLAESQEHQTAISDVLRLISSSPGDVQPVLVSVAEHSARICEAQIVDILTVKGDRLHYAAEFGDFGRILYGETAPLNRETVMGRSVCDKRPIHVVDLQSLDHDFPLGREYALAHGHRTTLAVPLIREDRALGTILVRRAEVRPFDDRHIALLKTFADQAAIAIENARLFDEVKAKARELQESLEYQTATADVLNVISRSTTNVQPVFDAIAMSAARLFAPCETTLTTVHNGQLHWGATASLGRPVEAIERVRSIYPLPFDVESSPSARAVHERRIIQISDVLAPDTPENTRRAGNAGEFRSITFVPLLREGIGIGTIILTHPEAGFKLSPKQLALVQTFADQAVIAIENARLFDEVQAKTRDLSEALTYQTGSSNILSVIASSPTDVAPVLQAIVKSACELCDAYDALVRLKVGDELQPSAHHGPIPASRDKWPINRNWTGGHAVIDKKPVHVHDVLSAEGDDFPETRKIARQQGFRTFLSVPLLSEGECIGVIVLRRIEVHPFSDKQIALLQTFADQAVIAIGNARMFEEVQQRTRELSQSLDDLRAAQERLIQTEKLASLGQLTAGIAHEIKNPLNFVNNFSSLSVELIDEMREALSDIGLDNNRREQLNEITQMLKGNLEKVVQHGKRADSIVKNMLQHSREGSGEHRHADINAVVEESLNLAYHGARAEKADFTVTLERKFDPAVGTVDVYPQEITRALLNLISNGFYATTKRKAEAADGFEPTLCATTRNLGDKVEIRIRDNGTGIPEEVKEKIFNPFFTTKPAGEGTGLGLSMSHDIIVKQHGGSIDLETRSGLFTEFRIVLPRTSKG